MRYTILLLVLVASVTVVLSRSVNKGYGRGTRRYGSRLFTPKLIRARPHIKRVFVRRKIGARPALSRNSPFGLGRTSGLRAGKEDGRFGLGRTSALRAGKEGAFDFADQYNAIIPDKKAAKPTKQPVKPDYSNKINIESKILEPKVNVTSIEKVYSKGTAILHCTFDSVQQIGSYKQAKIWWTKLPAKGYERPVIMAAGTQVRMPDDRVKVITFPDNSFSIMVIRDTLAQDAGQYKCSLPTVTGTLTKFTTLQVLESGADKVSISNKENTLSSGDELRLYCRPDDSTLNVWWTAKDKSGNSIEIFSGFSRVAGHTLEVPNIQSQQAGVYTCHVENRFGSPIRHQFTVQVKEEPEPIKAYIGGLELDGLLSKYYRNPVFGDDVNLRCDTKGIPTPTIAWYKSGYALSDSPQYTITSFKPSYKENSVTSRLTINNFQKTDNGVYICSAVNDVGRTQQQFLILGKANAVVPADDEDEKNNVKKIEVAAKICKGDCQDDVAQDNGSGFSDDE